MGGGGGVAVGGTEGVDNGACTPSCTCLTCKNKLTKIIYMYGWLCAMYSLASAMKR